MRWTFKGGLIFGFLVCIPILVALAPHDVHQSKPNNNIADSQCGAEGHVTNVVLTNSASGVNLYNVTCSYPTNPGQPPVRTYITVAR